MEEEEKNAVLRVLESGHLVQGAKVEEFEALFSDFVGTKGAVATNSGTSAIHTALTALGVGPGDEVILPAITFFSCAAMVAACGATPVVVDVEREDYTMSPAEAAVAVNPATKALMPVHIYGQPADMGAILDLASDHDIAVLEDGCQSHGARYEDSMVGSMGSVGCFSFYPSKIMTTGEGGMLVTNDEEVAEHSRMFRNHGARAKYSHEILGFNYRMTDLAAALGIEQLRRVDNFIDARTRNAALLSNGLAGIDGLTPPEVQVGRTHVFYQYVIRVTEEYPLGRDEVMARLGQKGVESRPSYPMPIHRQRAFEGVGRAADCPVAEAVLPQMLEIPVHPSLTSEDLETIVEAISSLS